VTKGSKNIIPGRLLLLLAVAAHITLALWYNFTQDDAYITFRYAANYVDGHGLVFNIGEQVEGYTNFLWLLFMIIGRLLTFDLALFSKILGLFCSSVSLVMIFLTGRLIDRENAILPGLACLIAGAMYSFAYWSVAGLETAAFSLMVISSLYFYLRRSFFVVPVLILATLLRPEGGLLFLFVCAYDILSYRKFNRYITTIIVAYILSLMPLGVFKLVYFGGLFPNPFYAKTDFTFYKYYDGLKYVGRYFLHYLGAGLFILPAIFAIKRRDRVFRTILLFLLIYIVYIILVGGDVLKVHRFFVPLMPLFAVCIIYGLSAIFKKSYMVLVFVGVILAWQLYIPREYVKNYHYAEVRLTAKMKNIARDLMATDKSDFSVTVSTIGIFSYYLPGHKVIDMLGLTDTTIARHPDPPVAGLETTWKESRFNIPYILSLQPDYILFSTGRKPSAPAEKALHLYSGFLNSYRTTTYYFEGFRHDIYKRYFKIPTPVARDIDIGFINAYSRGFHLHGTRQYREAVRAFSEALKYIPDGVFSYAHYLIAENLRKSDEHERSYDLLLALAQADTLSYEVFKDLYVYEYTGTRDLEKAAFYRQRLEKLIPWYLPILDANVGWRE